MLKNSQQPISTIITISGLGAGLDVDGGSLHRSMPSSGRDFGKRFTDSAMGKIAETTGPNCLERSNPSANCGCTRSTCPANRAWSEGRLSRLSSVKQMSYPGTALRRLPVTVRTALVVNRATKG